MGPLLDGSNLGTSGSTIKAYLDGSYPGTARFAWSIVDVRDVAEAHLAAMTNPKAVGNRYLCTNGSLWASEIAQDLDQNFANRGYKVNTHQLPNWQVKLYARIDKSASSIVDILDVEYTFSNQKIKDDLGIEFRSTKDAVLAMGESLIALGIV
jgi:dihydroflavonol-4-reductase